MINQRQTDQVVAARLAMNNAFMAFVWVEDPEKAQRLAKSEIKNATKILDRLLEEKAKALTN